VGAFIWRRVEREEVGVSTSSWKAKGADIFFLGRVETEGVEREGPEGLEREGPDREGLLDMLGGSIDWAP
jgi:hypothetical protein